MLWLQLVLLPPSSQKSMNVGFSGKWTVIVNNVYNGQLKLKAWCGQISPNFELQPQKSNWFQYPLYCDGGDLAFERLQSVNKMKV